MSHSLTVDTLTLDRAHLMTAVAVIEGTLSDLVVKDDHTAAQSKEDCLKMIKDYLESQRSNNNVIAMAALFSYGELCALYRVLKFRDEYQAILREATTYALSLYSTLDVDEKLTKFKEFFENYEPLTAEQLVEGSYRVHG